MHPLVALAVGGGWEVWRDGGKRGHALIKIMQQGGDLLKHLLADLAA